MVRHSTLKQANKKYQLILADPPWQYTDQGTRASPEYSGKQREHTIYLTMSLKEICELGEVVKGLTAENAILLLWCTHPLKRTHPWPVIDAWGFKYSTAMPWVKMSIAGKLQIGFGHAVRSCSEELLICTKGKIKELGGAKNIRGAIMAPRREHSEKPEEQYEIGERICPKGPWLEMFGRNTHPGWDMWGVDT